jgi:hypothetical protein
MFVHIVGSMRNFDNDLHIMQAITNVVEENNGFIARNWIVGVNDRKIRGSTPETDLDWNEIVEANINAVIQADALIIEGSRFSYGQGYQTAIALQHNKPVLNLYREDLPEYKEWPDKLFVSGVSHPLFTNKAYKNEDELKKIVTKFMSDHAKKHHELNIKIALDNDVYAKLDELSQEYGTSKASIIKDILSQKIRGK